MAHVKGPHPLGPFVVYVICLLARGSPANLPHVKVVDGPTLFAPLALQYS